MVDFPTDPAKQQPRQRMGGLAPPPLGRDSSTRSEKLLLTLFCGNTTAEIVSGALARPCLAAKKPDLGSSARRLLSPFPAQPTAKYLRRTISMNAIKKILVPTDFSAHADEAFRVAHTLARAIGAEVILFHVARPPAVVSEGGRSWPNRARGRRQTCGTAFRAFSRATPGPGGASGDRGRQAAAPPHPGNPRQAGVRPDRDGDARALLAETAPVRQRDRRGGAPRPLSGHGRQGPGRGTAARRPEPAARRGTAAGGAAEVGRRSGVCS